METRYWYDYILEKETEYVLSQINGNGDERGRSERYSGIELKIALDHALGVLGNSVAETMLEAIVDNGIDLQSHTTYSIAQMEKLFTQIFGKDTAELLIERLTDYFRSKNKV